MERTKQIDYARADLHAIDPETYTASIRMELAQSCGAGASHDGEPRVSRRDRRCGLQTSTGTAN